MPVVQISAGSKGFDCNVVVSAREAAALHDAGFRFAVRYVRRNIARTNDISAYEVARLHRAGIAVMPVQHVESDESWEPSDAKAIAYGNSAVAGAFAAGIPIGTTLWLDLEGVSRATPDATIIRYCNIWHERVQFAGFHPGIYVGWHCGLTPDQLYWRLRFDAYWAAYNLNADQFPVIRGVQMRQKEAKGDFAKPRAVAFPIDVNVVTGDKMGGLPYAYAPDEWQPLTGVEAK